jgi:hypothetical protein
MLFSFLEGYRESFLWFYKANYNKKDKLSSIELHPLFSVQRMIFIVSLTLLNFYYYYEGIMLFIIPVSYMLMFSFIHNGIIYYYRNLIDKKLGKKKPIYDKKWFDQSTTSTAILTKYMTPVNRTIFFLIGLIFNILLIIRFDILST